MFTDGELFARSSAIIEQKYFDKKLAPVISFIKKFTDEHDAMPAIDIVNAKFGTKLAKLDHILDSDKEWYFENIEEFCRTSSLEETITKGAEMIENGTYGGLETMVKESLQIALQRDIGIDYFQNPRERLEKLRQEVDGISTGWKTFDDMVPVGRGNLVYFSALSGMGKSVALQNLAVNYVNQGMNVVYITLELSPELVAKRVDAMMTGVPNASIFRNMEEVEYKLKQQKKKCGKFFIHYMESNVTTPRHIENYLREFIIQHECQVDVVIVDYADLIAPNEKRVDIGNIHIKEKLVAESLRNIAKRFNMICFTAAQINKTGYDAVSFTGGNIAGSQGKMNTSDLFVSINNTPQLRERGEIEFTFLKTRNSGGQGKTLTMEYNTDTLRITDLVDGSKPKETQSSSDSGQPTSNGTPASVQTLLAKIKKT